MFKIGFKEELEEAEVIIKKYEKSLHTYENIIETKGKMVVSFLLLLFIPKKKCVILLCQLVIVVINSETFNCLYENLLRMVRVVHIHFYDRIVVN